MSFEVQDLIKDVQRLAEATQKATGERTAQVELIEAVDKLHVAVLPPAERLNRLRGQNWDVVCARLLVEMGVVQAIVARGEGQPVHASELSKETGQEELLIIRLMRPLITYRHRIFDEVAEHTYAANATTLLLGSEGSIGGLKHFTDLLYPLAANIVPYFREKGTLPMFSNGPDEKLPFAYAYGQPIFDHFKHDAEAKQAFDWYMAGRRQGAARPWFHVYPAAQELGRHFQGHSKQDTLIVDVGGNQGHDLLAFRQENPALPGRFILQDLAETLNNLQDPQRFDGTNVERMEHDFFTPQPVKGALAYYFRAIFHDWDDARSREILQHTAKAMTKGYSRILIDDWVLPATGVKSRPAAVDITMMLYCGSCERELKQWEELLQGTGLKIVKIWGGSDRENIIEVMLE